MYEALGNLHLFVCKCLRQRIIQSSGVFPKMLRSPSLHIPTSNAESMLQGVEKYN